MAKKSDAQTCVKIQDKNELQKTTTTVKTINYKLWNIRKHSHVLLAVFQDLYFIISWYCVGGRCKYIWSSDSRHSSGKMYSVLDSCFSVREVSTQAYPSTTVWKHHKPPIFPATSWEILRDQTSYRMWVCQKKKKENKHLKLKVS